MTRPATQRAGHPTTVLVADGYGVQLRVQRSRLVVQDGMGSSRRTRELARIERDVRRIVVLADTGTVTLDAVRWCADVGISVVQVDRDARLLLVAGAPGTDDARLRRAQAAAAGSTAGLEIARALLTAKLQGQAQVARTELGSAGAGDTIDRLAEQLPGADLVGCRDLEAQASNVYFAGWAGYVQCHFAEHDQPQVPGHWMHFGARRSLIQRSATARSAATPINALLNYSYALAEVECRLALLTLGLDPGMGIVHTDRKDRDSLALDLLEPLRPVVERHVLTLLASHTFRAADFHETRQGVCRLLEPLTHDLIGWMPAYAAVIAPLAEQISHALARSSPGQIELRTPLSRANTTNAQQRGQRSANRRETAVPMPKATCRTCGTELYDKRRQLCSACWPVTRDAHARLRQEAGRRTRAEAVAQGWDPAQTPQARSKRSQTLRTVKAVEAAWAQAGTGPSISEALLHNDVLPALRAVSIRQLVEATGLSSSACSRLRAGKMTPHPRHWGALAALAGTQVAELSAPGGGHDATGLPPPARREPAGP